MEIPARANGTQRPEPAGVDHPPAPALPAAAEEPSSAPFAATAARGSSLVSWPAVALLLVATLAAYSNSLHGPFIFDDLNDIAGNTSIRHLQPLSDVFLAHSGGRTAPHGRPVVRLSLAVNYAMGGLGTLPYHLTNLAVHLLAALTLFGIVRRTLLLPGLEERFRQVATPLALCAALLWSLHPLQTAAVTYVVQRYESMMGLFSLLALYAVIRAATSVQPRAWEVASVAAALIALGCKEVAVVLPLCILLCDRAFLAGSFREAWGRRRALYLGLAGALVVFALFQFSIGSRTMAGYNLPFTWFEYARTQPGVILHYLRLSLWPRPLVLDYGWPIARTPGEILPGALVVGALAALTAHALVRRPQWGFLGAWFFLILAPTSSIFPIADPAFLHRMYLPLAAVAAAAVLGGYLGGRAAMRGGWISARVAVILGVCVVAGAAAFLGVDTWRRNLDFSSAFSIWTDTAAKAPRNPRAHYNLGCILESLGEMDAAGAQYEKTLEINPDDTDANNNLGLLLVRRGRMDEAIALYRRALKVDPDHAKANFNLGLALARLGNLEEAIPLYRRALGIVPDWADAHYSLGIALAARGQAEEAIAHYRKALEGKPESADVHYNLGLALAGRGRTEEAIVHFQRATELNPDAADAHNNLGSALAASGRTEEAIAHFQRALKIDPDQAEPHFNLGYVLLMLGRAEEAMAHFLRAVEVNPAYAKAHFFLGRTLAGRGQRDAAIAHYRRALEIDPGYAEARAGLEQALQGARRQEP